MGDLERTVRRALKNRVTIDGDCWIWSGRRNEDGYGMISYTGDDGRRTTRGAHRVIYEVLVGPVPDGKELDHVEDRGCRSRACVNPDHLEPVTHHENVLRGATARPLVRTHCRHNHEMTDRNTYWDRGRLLCRQCQRDREMTRRERRREVVG